MKFSCIVLLTTFVASSLAFPHKTKQTPLGVPYQGKPIIASKKLLSTKNVPFVEHPAGNSSWLGMNFDFQYVKPIFDAVNSTQSPLLSRGESHITVISPPEFAVLATAGITIDRVNTIARDLKIQSSKVKIICLGREDIISSGIKNTVYQLIVSAPNLVKIRQKLFQEYTKQGGNTALFDPNSFWPHITVGFTTGDVFIQDGVYKGSNVCYSRVSLKSMIK